MIGVDRPAVLVRFHTRGPWLVGVAVVQGPGEPTILRARVNMAELEKLYRAMIARKVAAGGVAVGFGFLKKAFKSIKKAVRKVAKSKVIKGIAKGLKKVVKSPITKWAIAATAVAFPAVGLPAQAALMASNKILDGVERGSKAARAAVRKLKRLAKTRGRGGAKARKALKILTKTNSWRKGLKVAERRALSPRALAARRARLRRKAALRRRMIRAKLARVRRPRLRGGRSRAAQLAALARMSPAQRAQLKRLAALKRARARKPRASAAQLAALARMTPAQRAGLKRLAAARARARGVAGALPGRVPAADSVAVGGACECG
jgi:hypothetical protein